MVHSACEHDDIVSSVSVNANGNRFVSASHDKRWVKFWKINIHPSVHVLDASTLVESINV